MNSRGLLVIGIAFTAFLIGIAISNPLVSAAPKTTDKPPSFQVLTDNYGQLGGSWIGGVAGYDTVTIILSEISTCAGSSCPARPRPYVYVYFQTGSTIPETPLEFSWSLPLMAQTYTVPRGAETIVVLVTGLQSPFVCSLAIALT